MKLLLIALLVLAAWIGLTAAVAYAVPERTDPDALPDLIYDEHWLLRTPSNPVESDKRPPLTTTTTTRFTTPGPIARAAAPRPPPTKPNTGGVEQWRPLLAAYGDWDVDLMLAIMRCESGGNPDARNASSGAAGLLQIYPARAGSFDPVTNIAQGHAKWAASGYSPWVSSRSCWG